MLDLKQTVIYAVGVIILIVLVVFALLHTESEEAPKRAAQIELAQCVADSGSIFYGAFWCPHCAQQKSAFGIASKKLPYVECSTPDRSGQTEVCVDEEIRSFPTWKFPGGAVCTGFVSPEIVAHLSSCSIPNYGEERTVEGLYKELVDDRIRESFARAQGTNEDLEESLLQARAVISLDLQEKYGTNLTTTTNISHLLSSIAEKFQQCTGL